MQISETDFQGILKNEMFAKSDRDVLMRVLREFPCSVADFGDGEVIHSPQNRETRAVILLSGKATVQTPGESRRTLLRFLRAGDMFGIANLFSSRPYVSTVRAVGNCRICRISEDAIRALLEEDKGFLYQYLGFLSGRIRFLNQKIGYLTAGSAERRLALYLSSLGEDTVELDSSISALSDLLDVGRASLYRAFDKLTEDGYLRKVGRKFILLDADGMLQAYR